MCPVRVGGEPAAARQRIALARRRHRSPLAAAAETSRQLPGSTACLGGRQQTTLILFVARRRRIFRADPYCQRFACRSSRRGTTSLCRPVLRVVVHPPPSAVPAFRAPSGCRSLCIGGPVSRSSSSLNLLHTSAAPVPVGHKGTRSTWEPDNDPATIRGKPMPLCTLSWTYMPCFDRASRSSGLR